MSKKISPQPSNKSKGKKDLKLHWNRAYAKNPIEQLGWYEEKPEPSLELIAKCKLNQDASIFTVGTGATTLIDEIIKLGYKNIIANDISSNALDRLKERLGNKKELVNWIVDDITKPTKSDKIKGIDLWHDRAVLHFFKDSNRQDNYFKLIHQLVNKNGFVIIAAFNLEGATQCSGLPVFRFNEDMLQQKLGKSFQLIDSFNYTHNMPSGDTRAYVYTLFQRI